MPRATWNGVVLAECEHYQSVEGNTYFPPDSIKREFLQESETHTTCPWKGVASYYHIVVNGQVNKDAAWYYPSPKDGARKIKNYVAFWKGVEIEK